jgi:FAD:protein FMN transferase
MPYNRRNFLNLLARVEPRTHDCWLHVSRTAMACRFEVTLSRSEEHGVVAATEALDEVERLEAQLTVFRESSEVSYVNANAGNQAVNISQSLFDLLALCKLLYVDTHGAFDITAGPLTRCWGFLRREARLPGNAEIEHARSFVGSNKIHLDEAARSVRFSKPGVQINLGSIGKGYALDRAARHVSNRISTALLNAGASSMRAIGAGEGKEGWVVGLRHPRSKLRRLGVLRLRDCSLATSGNEEQFFDHAGRRFSHIIDPRTGWPSEGVTSVSVVTPDGALSDALATAFFVGGCALAEEYCAKNSEVLVVMLESNSQVPIVIGSNAGCDGLGHF